MSKKIQEEAPSRLRHFEQFEERLAMTAVPLAEVLASVDAAAVDIVQQAELIHFAETQSAIESVRKQYGLDGRGQTVAVIDSGIAWDHYALGGGFGAGHRVVGGWDFAENDANPYDDGPAGFHGTHVSGIIGSSDSKYTGIASGVDLVGLRVFDDQGKGSFDWLAQALQWVHDNRDNYANPITTVNLSLGADWNANTVPNWGTLEAKFAQLESDGIFISVAAGNSFAKYQTAGLAYPAVSPHVVPVASHGATGELSSFSQRNSRVLVAPGESIRSTVPDHLFGGTKTNQFLGASGTSMAAPYVAGASTLLREAYEFMGIDHVTQKQLYDRFLNSADKVFDQMTGGWYSRVNVEKALSQIIGDNEGNTWDTAKQIGSLKNGTSISGTIGNTSDRDAFSFTAATTGTLTLNVASTHNLKALLAASGGSAQWNGNQLTMQVTAGQQYKFSVETTAGIGHYQIEARIQPSVNAVDLGTVFSSRFNNQSVAGQQYFQVTAGRNGLLTMIGAVNSGNATFKLYDAQMREVGLSQITNGQVRIDANATQGQMLYVRVDGTANVDLTAVNLVSLENGQLTVNGTNKIDDIRFSAGDKFEVRVNDVAYSFERAAVRTVSVYGHGGNDSFAVNLDQSSDQVTMSRNEMQVQSSSGWSLNANEMQTIIANGGGGNDRVTLLDSAGLDRLFNDRSMVAMQGTDYANYTVGFQNVSAISRSGADRAELTGSTGNDLFTVGDQRGSMQAGAQSIHTRGFSNLKFAGGGGQDLSLLMDSIANDSFVFGVGTVSAQIDTTQIEISGVVKNIATATQGFDTVVFNDSAGADLFSQNGNSSQINGSGFQNTAIGFRHVTARSSSGRDVAQLIGTAGDDTAWMNSKQTVVASNLLKTIVDGFSRVNVVANQGGRDVVYMHGTTGADQVYDDATGTSMQTASGALNRAVGFRSTNVDGWGGDDQASIVGSEQVESVSVAPNQFRLQRAAQQLAIQNIRATSIDGRGGADEIVFAQLDENDNLLGTANRIRATIDSQTVEAVNFGVLEAQSKNGNTSNYDIAAVDYLFMLDGSWKKK